MSKIENMSTDYKTIDLNELDKNAKYTVRELFGKPKLVSYDEFVDFVNTHDFRNPELGVTIRELYGKPKLMSYSEFVDYVNK